MNATEMAVQDFATLIYLAIEVKRKVCRNRFVESDSDIDHGEADIWQWAQKTATTACQSGWRPVDGRVLCPECVGKSHVQPNNSRGRVKTPGLVKTSLPFDL